MDGWQECVRAIGHKTFLSKATQRRDQSPVPHGAGDYFFALIWEQNGNTTKDLGQNRPPPANAKTRHNCRSQALFVKR